MCRLNVGALSRRRCRGWTSAAHVGHVSVEGFSLSIGSCQAECSRVDYGFVSLRIAVREAVECRKVTCLTNGRCCALRQCGTRKRTRLHKSPFCIVFCAFVIETTRIADQLWHSKPSLPRKRTAHHSVHRPHRRPSRCGRAGARGTLSHTSQLPCQVSATSVSL
jgi:hypothetical protein